MFKKPKPVPDDKNTVKYASLFLARSIAAKFQGERLIRQKLVDRGYSPGVIDKAMEFGRQEGFLNDLRLANIVAENLMSSGRGAGQLVRQKLQALGVGSSDIETALAAQSAAIDIEGALAEKIASKFRGFNPATSGRDDQRRVEQWCQRKGYSFSQIRGAMQNLEST